MDLKIETKTAAAGALLIGIGIALGAFGAHGLKNILTPETLQVFETGVRYQMYAGFGVLVLSLFGSEFRLPVKLILAGCILFSLSLYLLCMHEIWGEGLKKLGMVTPLGGLCMISGWMLAFWKFWKTKIA